MTSPSLLSQHVPVATRKSQTRFQRIGIPLLLFGVTMFTTTAVGMRYMHNFQLGTPPLASDADILPFEWVIQHLQLLATGLPFSLTLVGILLTHEFGHYFACRMYGVRCTLPYMLPSPSLSGTFGAVIRLNSPIRSRPALIAIGAAGPIAGFLVAICSVLLGLSLSTYSAAPLVYKVQSPLTILLLHRLLHAIAGANPNISLIVPHPILTASWIGLLITALNLIPAGQLDGGHILYSVSPTLHRWSTRIFIGVLLGLGFFYWAGWLAWGVVLMTPGMRHPRVADTIPMTKWHIALVPACLLILIACGTFEPFHGYGLIDVIEKLASRHH